MSYILGDTTLPTPKPGNFAREQLETGGLLRMLNGATKKDITNRKERFTIIYEKLTRTEVNAILAEYNKQATVYFSVNETNLTINATLVHVEIANREYNTGGIDYREDLTLSLEEVR